MTFIIRSDAPLANPAANVGMIHGYNGPTDYRAMLDLVHQRYKLDGADIAFADAFTYTRASDGYYSDVLGRKIKATANQPRFHTLSEQQESGLLIDRAYKNYLAAGTNGSTFTAVSSSSNLALSWEGTGDVTASGTGITALGKTVVSNGRTTKFYTRSGAITGTIAVTGSVTNVMATNSDYVVPFAAYSYDKVVDSLRLSDALAALVAGGTGTILTRWALMPDNGVANRALDHITAFNTAAPQGELAMTGNYSQTAQGTVEVRAYPDNAAINASTQIARVLGSRPQTVVVGGIAFTGFGATAKVISNGQVSSGTAAGVGVTPPSAFGRVWLGMAPTGSKSTLATVGALLTHVIVYDRMLTDQEAIDVSLF